MSVRQTLQEFYPKDLAKLILSFVHDNFYTVKFFIAYLMPKLYYHYRENTYFIFNIICNSDHVYMTGYYLRIFCHCNDYSENKHIMSLLEKHITDDINFQDFVINNKLDRHSSVFFENPSMYSNIESMVYSCQRECFKGLYYYNENIIELDLNENKGNKAFATTEAEELLLKVFNIIDNYTDLKRIPWQYESINGTLKCLKK